LVIVRKILVTKLTEVLQWIPNVWKNYIIRFDKRGTIAEHWGVIDQMAMMQQLGLTQSSSEQNR